MHRAILAGLLLAASMLGAAVAPVPSPAAQRNKLPPTVCTVEPRTREEVTALVAAATPTPEPAEGTLIGVASPADLPQGEPAVPETVAGITAAAREFAACLNAADWPRWLALMTDRSVPEVVGPGDVEGLFASVGTPVPGENPGMTIAWVRVSDARVLEDGRVGAVVVWGVTNNPRPRPAPEANFHVFQRVGGRWLLDEEITGNVEECDDPRGVLSPAGDAAAPPADGVREAAGGYGEVDSAVYAEPTLMGARFTVAATFKVASAATGGEGVGCEFFTIERGERSVTAAATCRAADALVGLPAYLSVEVSGPRRSSDAPPLTCEDAAPLAAYVTYACTVELPDDVP